MDNNDFFEISPSLKEEVDVEFKLARGNDGTGKLPKDFWESYSAMANTDGGLVYLGVSEDKNRMPVIMGVSNPDKVRKELVDSLNNPQKVSINLLSGKDITVHPIDEGLFVIRIAIPRAKRTQRPVYLNNNPLTGTYRRNFEGDYQCSEEDVKHMLADQQYETRDYQLAYNFDMNDIDAETLKIYRQVFSNRQPDHPFNDYDNIEFLRNIRGWKVDRESGNQGLTGAGLLMFGKLQAILDFFPNYVVDYQERANNDTTRWTDRITTDYSWAGNLYSFYRKVIQKLYADLKIPFVLKGDQRIDDTEVHTALREAFVNTMIHADYSGRLSILVVKRPDLFGFRNPGTLRIPREAAIRGGNSDCRNRTLQKMFQLIGLGEQAGSGIPKIYSGWKSQHWKKPEIDENIENNSTIMVLKTSSLLPDAELKALEEELGSKRYKCLSQEEVIALVTASTEKKITHRRLTELTKAHNADLSKTLHGLVKEGLLHSKGVGRGTYYYKPDNEPNNEDFDIDFTNNAVSLDANAVSLDANAVSLDANAVSLDAKYSLELLEISEDIRNTKKIDRNKLENTIIELCKVKPLKATEISELLARNERTIRENYLRVMCDSGALEQTIPDNLTHPDQRYKVANTLYIE